jgi:general secretion pathway protein C
MVALAQGEKRSSWLSAGLPEVAAAALTVLIAFGLAQLTWRVFLPAPEAHEETVSEAPQINAPEERPDYALRIANLHLFGQAREARATRVLDAPETRLNLTLRGVYATGDEQALAIIASGGSDEKFYRLGDAISGGGTLKAVYGDRVILEHNLQMETLKLPKSEATGITGVAEDQGATPYLPGASDVSYAPADDGLLSGQTSQVDLGQLREQILQNPGRLGDMVQATPVNEHGRFKGYRLTPQGNAQLFSQLGLQEGDIVTSVNGIAIDRPDKGLLALQDLVKAEQVSVTVLRNGTEITVEHPLGQ